MVKNNITEILLTEYENDFGKQYRISKEYLWIDTANRVSMLSTCCRKKVGAVITNYDMNKVISIGYNGDEKGGKNQCEDKHTPGKCGCLHAEINCIAQSKMDLTDCIMFLSLSPCKTCSKLIVNSNIRKVIYYEEYRLLDGVQLLKDRNIEVVNYKNLFKT